MILERIVDEKRKQLRDEMQSITIDGWKERLKRPGLHRSTGLFEALKGGGISIVAEVKKASPSRGVIREDFQPVEIAREYSSCGVQAISVLTEKNFFQGCDDYLVKIRQTVPLPLLRKDFILDAWQIYQSKYLGADAILLIVSILSDEELKKFQAVASILGLSSLVEVHTEEEVERALNSGARIIGINNRNLKNFEVSLDTTEKLMNIIPHDKVIVSESGIKTYEDMQYLEKLGVNAVLVGETFMRSESIRDSVNLLKYGTKTCTGARL